MRSSRLLAFIVLVVACAAPVWAQGPRFYPDDPLRVEPTPLPVADINARALSEVLEQLKNSLRKTGERHPANGVIPARAVNTLGDVMDSEWYVNRHGTRRMTIDELQRGSGNANPPATGAPLQVLVVKPFGFESRSAGGGQQGSALSPALRSCRATKGSPPARRW